MLYESLHQKLLALPDETLVYPAHGAGSLCGKHLSTETVSTIGVQRQYNYALQPMSKEEFVEVVTAEQPDALPYFTYDAILNTKERPTLEETLEQVLNPFGLEEFLKLRDSGAQMFVIILLTQLAGGVSMAGCGGIGSILWFWAAHGRSLTSFGAFPAGLTIHNLGGVG